MIRRFYAFVILPLVLLTLNGCIQMEHSLTLRNDGTASYTLDYSISEQTITQLHAMEKLKLMLAKADGEPAPPDEIDPLIKLFLDPDEDAIRKALKKYESDGLTVRELEVRTISSRRHVTLKLEITDLKKVAATDFFRNNGFNLTKDKKGNYVFYREPYINRPGEIAKVPTEKEVKDLIPLLSEFSTVVRVTVPGNIVSTTAFNNAVNTASWNFDFDRDPSALTMLQHQPFRIVFSAPDANLPEMHYRGSTIK